MAQVRLNGLEVASGSCTGGCAVPLCFGREKPPEEAAIAAMAAPRGRASAVVRRRRSVLEMKREKCVFPVEKGFY